MPPPFRTLGRPISARNRVTRLLRSLTETRRGRNWPTTFSTPRREGSRSAAEWLAPFERSFGSSAWPGLVVFLGAGQEQPKAEDQNQISRPDLTRPRRSSLVYTCELTGNPN